MDAWQELLAVIGMGLVASVSYWRRTAEARAARKRLRGATRELVEGELVRLVGRVVIHGEPLVAPLSGRPCVAFQSTAHLTSDPTENVTTEATRARMTPFVLVTETGKVIVGGTRVEVALPASRIVPTYEQQRDFLDAEKQTGRFRTSLFDEALVLDGMTISVLGLARREMAAPGGEAGFRDGAIEWHLVGDDAHPLTIGSA